MNKNPYLIMELDNIKNPSKDDIKKAYKRLILKYHPDKNTVDTTDKFKEIQTAYEILSNDDKRKEYDSLPANEKVKYYETLKSLIIKKYPYVGDYLSFIIRNFYNENEKDLQNDLETFNFDSIYKNFMEKIPDVLNKVDYKSPKLKPYVIDININGKISGSLSDRYQNKYQNLLIERETKEEINIFVPFIEDIYVLENEGEIGINNVNGNIIIEVDIPNIYKNFTKLDDDLYVEIEIPLYNYLYGGFIKFENLDNTEIILEHKSLLENNIIKINGKGFLKKLEENTNDENNKEERGDMIIIIKIKDLDNLKEKIKILS
jgi:DnaJ-class molecular chaperone